AAAKPPAATTRDSAHASAKPTSVRVGTSTRQTTARSPARASAARSTAPAPAASSRHVQSDRSAPAAPAPKNMSSATGTNRHVAAEPGCAAALTAAPSQHFDRVRASSREFSWADMARFFELADDEAEPDPPVPD